MVKSFRRFEVLLPLMFNDGLPVPDDAIGQTIIDLRERFGAVSLETQRIFGQWLHAGQTYHDELSRAFIDAPDDPANVEFFRGLKEILKQRFQQIDIWIVSFAIDVI